jgi:hypothetical protein
VSTFRLEPEHFILTTGTFNLIVKDRIAFRLSGALSVRTRSPCGNPHVLETFQPYRVGSSAVNPLQSQDFHLFCTTGSCPHGWGNSDVGNSLRRATKRCFRLKRQGLSARAEAEDGQISKDRWEVLLFAKPFRDFVPECGPRDPGSNGGLLNWMPQAAARMQANLDTQSLVLDCEVYTRTFGIAQGGIKRVT